MATVFSPFRSMYRALQRQAHDSPVLFWSCVLGGIGPVMVTVIPPIRRKLGYERAEPAPTTYPLPRRPRRPVQGYDDE
ncbi:hypothetical protein OBBRIDRAFT_740345 [Obba rivulosa]|uniref:NADH-ubiquinone oxidoreductase 9.5 kDa subunit n=1 Tax=Obba rivulosa TaxID=1052685 RepID=A0A8E2DFU0_9APHY|nr:hypothetical protein OBBRIDRAFT_740345 [Obba rivulosa]